MKRCHTDVLKTLFIVCLVHLIAGGGGAEIILALDCTSEKLCLSLVYAVISLSFVNLQKA